ncbi:peptidase G2 autoproteolytic cleavage domain-containing protein [Paenibacillus sp. SN-8-1]|uniref:peptidase G2 autoproteolytic cleavage domain-containing protein n=1 Tax=Paenibacillus sp. SN-8-1 TaxID=3435409 RepID=UPI003D9A4D98
MSSNTTNLKLLKVDPITDGDQTFNFDTMLNANWDKIDGEVGSIRSSLTDQDVRIKNIKVDSVSVNKLSDNFASPGDVLSKYPEGITIFLVIDAGSGTNGTAWKNATGSSQAVGIVRTTKAGNIGHQEYVEIYTGTGTTQAGNTTYNRVWGTGVASWQSWEKQLEQTDYNTLNSLISTAPLQKGVLPTGTDVNTLTTPGVWQLTSTAASYTNAPPEDSTILTVHVGASASSYISQTALAVLSGKIYTRTRNSGTTWSSWVQSGITAAERTAWNEKLDKTGGTLTGNVTAPVIISNIENGTAPLQVASSTLVTNLNAEMVGGKTINQIMASAGASKQGDGSNSSVQGVSNTASGANSTAIGDRNTASTDNSFTQGLGNMAKTSAAISLTPVNNTDVLGTTSMSVNTAYAEGFDNQSTGVASHAEGISNKASGQSSHAEGSSTNAIGRSSHSEGSGSLAGATASHAEGSNTKAYGINSHTEGNLTYTAQAYNVTTHDPATGFMTLSTNTTGTLSVGDTVVYTATNGSTVTTTVTDLTTNSVTLANASLQIKSTLSFLLLIKSSSTASGAHAEGYCSNATNIGAHAEGGYTLAFGSYSHTEGYYTNASGSYSHSEGNSTKASGSSSHAEGDGSQATGTTSHAEGYGAIASGQYAHAQGSQTIASGQASHAEGTNSIAANNSAHAEGVGTLAAAGTTVPITAYSNSTDKTITVASVSGLAVNDVVWIRNKTGSSFSATITAINGNVLTIVTGYFLGTNMTHLVKLSTNGSYNSHAEGGYTLASGQYSHSEGTETVASGFAAHAEGQLTEASGGYSHAEGSRSVASNNYAHAEGTSTIASGQASHAEGGSTTASGMCAHAEGYGAVASGMYSHAQGYNTTAGYDYSHVMGQYGDASSAGGWFLANGTNTARGLAAKILSNGQMFADGAYSSAGADYAEMFEWSDFNYENEDRVGYFVTLDGEMIRKATSNDDYILGVVSSNPSVIGDNHDLNWKGRYLRDEWGRVKYHYEEVPAQTVETVVGYDEGNNPIIEMVEIPAKTVRQPMINPDWNPDEYYARRELRPEWNAVGMMGKLLVRDDGTCEVNGYCQSNDDGIATASDRGYRVMERVTENIIRILVK